MSPERVLDRRPPRVGAHTAVVYTGSQSVVVVDRGLLNAQGRRADGSRG